MRTRIISPLEQPNQVAEIIAAGDYKSRSSIKGNSELGSLSRSIHHMADAIGQKIERLNELSRTDPLTRVHNRRSFMELLEHEMKGFGRHVSPLSLLMIDLNRFKEFNDTHGHRLGDEILKHVAAYAWQSSGRSTVLGGWAARSSPSSCRKPASPMP